MKDEKMYTKAMWGSHNLAPEPKRKIIANFVKKIKEETLLSSGLSCQIIHNVRATVPTNEAGCLPSTSALIQIVKRESERRLTKLKNQPQFFSKFRSIINLLMAKNLY